MTFYIIVYTVSTITQYQIFSEEIFQGGGYRDKTQ